MTIQELFERNAALSLEKQHVLSELLGEHTWELDLEKGKIIFNDRYSFDVQVLGTESDVHDTWLWAWANRVSDIPRHLLTCAERIRSVGQANGILEFVTGELSRSSIGGHYFALIASGLCGADCFYRGPYEGGAIYVLVQSPEVRAKLDQNGKRIAMVVRELVTGFEVNHRAAFRNYVEQKGYAIDEKGDTISGRSQNGDCVKGRFDANGRILDLSA